MTDLTPKQQRFVDEYLVDLNATQAAVRAGYSARTANEQGARLLAKASVRAAVDAAKAQRSQRTGITAERVLADLFDIATADANDLIQFRYVPCPECFAGVQDPKVEPRPDCEACHGEGVGHAHVADTRKLTGAARKLYAGVRVTKEGLQVQMRSQDGALGLLFDHLGLAAPKRGELSGPNGGPIPVQSSLIEMLAKLSPDERASLRPLLLKLEGQN